LLVFLHIDIERSVVIFSEWGGRLARHAAQAAFMGNPSQLPNTSDTSPA
jgi:hypothetical protein